MSTNLYLKYHLYYVCLCAYEFAPAFFAFVFALAVWPFVLHAVARQKMQACFLRLCALIHSKQILSPNIVTSGVLFKYYFKINRGVLFKFILKSTPGCVWIYFLNPPSGVQKNNSGLRSFKTFDANDIDT